MVAGVGGGLGVGLIVVSIFAPTTGGFMFFMGTGVLVAAGIVTWRHASARVEVNGDGFVAFTRWRHAGVRWAHVVGLFAVAADKDSPEVFVMSLADACMSDEVLILGVIVERHDTAEPLVLEVRDVELVSVLGEYWDHYVRNFREPLNP